MVLTYLFRVAVVHIHELFLIPEDSLKVDAGLISRFEHFVHEHQHLR